MMSDSEKKLVAWAVIASAIAAFAFGCLCGAGNEYGKWRHREDYAWERGYQIGVKAGKVYDDNLERR
jgi:hypothetical protein